jgi:hypothetical protein
MPNSGDDFNLDMLFDWLQCTLVESLPYLF